MMIRSSIPDWLHTVLCLLGLVGVCWFLLRLGVSKAPDAHDPMNTPAKAAGCQSAVEHCTARATVRIDSPTGEPCNADKAKQRIESVLRDPLSNEGCAGVSARLSSECPEGCALEDTAPLVVPGQMKFQIDEAPNEAGQCSASGEIAVVVRGSCVKKGWLGPTK